MPTSATDNQHPRYGFSEQRLISTSVTNAALFTSGVARPPGCGTAVVVGITTAWGGAPGSVDMILEGSNDNTNWFVLSQLDAAHLFTANGQTRTLNSLADQQVDIERWAYLRVRTTTTAPTFTMTVIVTSISLDSEKFLYTETWVRIGDSPVSQTGTVHPRPAGTKFANVQVSATNVNRVAVTSYDVILQGSPNYIPATGAGTWIEIGRVVVTANGSQAMAVNLDREIDLGSFCYFRFVELDIGGPANVADTYTLRVYLSLDSMDWVDSQEAADGTGGATPSLDLAMLTAIFGAPSAEVAHVRTIDLYLLDANGAPLTASRRVECLLYDTALAGDLDLATNATWTAVGGGAAAISGVGTNRVVLTTDAAGHALLTVTDAAAETIYGTAVTPRGPLTVREVIWESQQFTMVMD